MLIKPIVSREDPLYRHNDYEIFFPGGGHTRDNVVVWFPKQSVLFGGCFLKSATSRGMGYVKEADIAEWPKAVNRVVERYGHAEIFVPGHGSRGNFHTIANTMELLRQYIKTEFNRDCLSCAIAEEH